MRKIMFEVADDNEAMTYENVFRVTETCQNGKERTFKKSVFTPIFGNDGKHLTETQRIEACTYVLRKNYYYNIEYIETKCTGILCVTDL